MGRIFCQASRVLIWLGEGPDLESTVRADVCIERLWDAYEKLGGMGDSKIKFRYMPSLPPEFNEEIGIHLPNVHNLHMSLNLPDLNSPEFQVVIELFRNPWFFRAWTWYEQFVAKEAIFHYGDKIWARMQLKQACLSVIELRKFTGLFCDYGDECHNGLSMVQGQLSPDMRYFCSTLRSRRGAECKYPHDLIHSLIRAAFNCPDIQVDYKQPFETLFSKSTWQVINQQGEPSMLRWLERDRRSSDLPTWAPDWRVRIGTELELLSVSPNFQYRATGSSHMIAGLSADCKIMSIFGIYWDSIEAVHPADASDLKKWAHLTFESAERLEKLYRPTEESLERELRRVMFLDTTVFLGEDQPTRWGPDSHDEYEKIESLRFSAAYSDDEDAKMNYGKLLMASTRMTERRAIFLTEGGRLDMAANTIQPGDIIALLLGGDLPFVLRRIEGSNHYTYVADCYVHGYMDGEGLVEAREAADPAWQRGDESWLVELDNGDLPFPVEDFHIH